MRLSAAPVSGALFLLSLGVYAVVAAEGQGVTLERSDHALDAALVQ
jgi:hypothetical protein